MKSAAYFVLRFLLVYAGLTLIYSSWFIHKYDTAQPAQTDPITRFVSYQVRYAADLVGYDARVLEDNQWYYATEDEKTMDTLYFDGEYALSVEEGCNSVSNIIIFLAFIVGFGGRWKKMLWFIPVGLVFIHVANVGRILLLGVINVDFAGSGFHFFHKYLFTAIIYGAIFLLWIWWINQYGNTVSSKPKATVS